MKRAIALLAVPILLFTAPGAGWAQDAKAAKAAYDRACARCHKVEKVVSWMKKHPEDAARKAWLDGKLTRHHARDAKLRAEVIAYLESVYTAEVKPGR